MNGKGTPRRTSSVRRGSAVVPAADASASASEVEISLHAMRFHALIGVLEHERTIPQPVEVDLTVWCRPVDGVVDYRRLYVIVEQVLGRGSIAYLEDVANQVGSAALKDERVDRVRVAVRKPHVALPGPLAYAEVVVQRRRDEA